MRIGQPIRIIQQRKRRSRAALTYNFMTHAPRVQLGAFHLGYLMGGSGAKSPQPYPSNNALNIFSRCCAAPSKAAPSGPNNTPICVSKSA